MCVSLFYVIDTGSIRPRARIRVTELGVTYLPFTFSSDAVYAYLPLALLGVPVSISNTFVYMHIHIDLCMFVYPLYVYSAMYTVMYTCIYI